MNLVLIAVMVVVLWVVSLGIYLYTSRQQQDLQADIESVQKILDRE